MVVSNMDVILGRGSCHDDVFLSASLKRRSLKWSALQCADWIVCPCVYVHRGGFAVPCTLLWWQWAVSESSEDGHAQLLQTGWGSDLCPLTHQHVLGRWGRENDVGWNYGTYHMLRCKLDMLVKVFGKRLVNWALMQAFPKWCIK